MKKNKIHVFIWKYVFGLLISGFLMTYIQYNVGITNLSALVYALKVSLWFITIATILVCVLLCLMHFFNDKPEKDKLIHSWFSTSTKYTLAFVCTLALVMQF